MFKCLLGQAQASLRLYQASKLRSMITAKGAEVFHANYLLEVILDCLSEAESSLLVY